MLDFLDHQILVSLLNHRDNKLGYNQNFQCLLHFLLPRIYVPLVNNKTDLFLIIHCMYFVILEFSGYMHWLFFYFVSLHIQSECGKIWTRKNSVFGHISHSAKIKNSPELSFLSNWFSFLNSSFPDSKIVWL